MKWGNSKSLSQRYYCLCCLKTFTPRKKIEGDRYLSLFKKWILNGSSIQTLTDVRGRKVSSATLWKHFDKFLKSPPQAKPLTGKKEIYLKADGKYFGHWGCLLLFREGTNIIFWDFVERENYFNYSFNLDRLKELSHIILGVTSDWHGSLVSAVSSLYPTIPHQRCLIHTQRLCQILLTRRPETAAGKNLLELVRLLNYINDQSQKVVWLKWLKRFEERYGKLIQARTFHEDKRHWWFTHKNLRRAFLTLKNSQVHLFLYLDNPNLGKDTNGVESEFSHLKQKLGSHRGLSRLRKVKFTQWFCYLKSVYHQNQKTN